MPRPGKRSKREGSGPPKRLDEMTEPELGQLMTRAAEAVKVVMPPRTGYVVLAFEFNAPAIGQYIANAERASVIQLLRETADRLERREEVGRIEFPR